jgi:hypothetical protein
MHLAHHWTRVSRNIRAGCGDGSKLVAHLSLADQESYPPVRVIIMFKSYGCNPDQLCR